MILSAGPAAVVVVAAFAPFAAGAARARVTGLLEVPRTCVFADWRREDVRRALGRAAMIYAWRPLSTTLLSLTAQGTTRRIENTHIVKRLVHSVLASVLSVTNGF
jgi:hypothetical protein